MLGYIFMKNLQEDIENSYNFFRNAILRYSLPYYACCIIAFLSLNILPRQGCFENLQSGLKSILVIGDNKLINPDNAPNLFYGLWPAAISFQCLLIISFLVQLNRRLKRNFLIISLISTIVLRFFF